MNEKNWLDFPLVSGLMVFDRPQQLVSAKASVECFFSQAWPNKELVVFNATPYPVVTPRWWQDRKCLEIRLRRRSTAQMEALCLENSSGEWCLNWLPDCWYSPDYIKTHLQHRDKEQLVTLRHKRVYALREKKLVGISNESVPCWSFYRYFPVDYESKTAVPAQFNGIIEVDNPSHLIVKFAREIVR